LLLTSFTRDDLKIQHLIIIIILMMIIILINFTWELTHSHSSLFLLFGSLKPGILKNKEN